MNKVVKSLEIRNEVIKLIKEKFNLNFSYSYNDLYKVKGGIVRRLKGNIWGESVKFSNFKDKRIIKEFNDLVLEVDNYLKSLNYEGFEIRLKKKVVSDICYEVVRKYNSFLEFSSEKEIRDYYNEISRELILSIKFKNN